jgi:hypothetical protein
MELYEARLLFSPEGLIRLSNIRDQVHPPLADWEDLIQKSLMLFEATIDETEPDEDGIPQGGELVYLFPEEDEAYHQFPFPFWLDDQWETIEPDEEEKCGVMPLTVQVLPEVAEQIERIIEKAPGLPTIGPVIDCSLWLFDQFAEGKNAGRRFFIYRPERAIVNPIPFPFW